MAGGGKRTVSFGAPGGKGERRRRNSVGKKASTGGSKKAPTGGKKVPAAKIIKKKTAKCVRFA